MTAVKMMCEEISRILSAAMCCRVSVLPTTVYSDTLRTPDGAESLEVWDGRTVTIVVSEVGAGDGTAHGRLLGRGHKVLCRMDEYPFDLMTSDSCHATAGRIRSAINEKMKV